MRTIARTSFRLLGTAALVLLLSGCLKATQDLTLNEDDTVDGDVVFAVNKSFLDLAGITADEFLEQSTQGEGPVPEGIEFETEPYEDDEFVGSRYTFDGAPLSAFSDPETGDLSIVREGDTFVVSGSLDANTEDLDPSGTPGAEQILESFDVRISITFPGDVESANGEVDGTTVTWRPELGETTEISAVGSASGGGGGGGALTWILIVAAIVVVGLIVIVVAMNRKKTGLGEEGSATVDADQPPPPPASLSEPVSPESTVDLPDAPDAGGGSG